MAKRSTPTWVFHSDEEATTVRLVGYRGGIRHTYARRFLEKPYSRGDLVVTLEDMGRETGIYPDTVEPMETE